MFKLKHLARCQSHTQSVFFLAATVLLLAATSAKAQFRYAGSDTVEPIISTAAVAYTRGHPGFKLPIQSTGTSVGMRELCGGRAMFVGASRPIKADESKACAAAGIQVVEMPVAIDAMVLVTSNKNTWLKDLTFAELRSVFDPTTASKVTSWMHVRSSFPDMPIRTAGPNIKHGTFTSFSESLDLKGFIRADFKDFAHHEETGKFVSDTKGAMGIMPIGDATTMSGDLKPVAINFGSGNVVPSLKEVAAGKYDKLSRTIYLYVNQTMLAKASPQEIDFVKFLVGDMEKFANFVNMAPLKPLQYQENIKRMASSR